MIEGEIEAGRRYTEDDFNKIIEIREREKLRVKLFMEQINQSEKTLVFCATQNHALAVRDLVNQMKASNDPNYCQRVTANDGSLGELHLRSFQDNEKSIPTILTTSPKTFDRRGCPKYPQHRADAPDQLDDRVQADHRARHAAV